MKLIQKIACALALGLCTANAANADESAQTCVVVSDLYGEISAEDKEWRQARLDALSEPTSACEELKLGLLLSHPSVSFQNDAKALDALSHALLMLPDDAVDKSVLGMVIEHIEERQTLRNMLGKSQRQLRYRQQQINTLRGQITQLKNLEAQLEDKARAAIEPDADLVDDAVDDSVDAQSDEPAAIEDATDQTDEQENDDE